MPSLLISCPAVGDRWVLLLVVVELRKVREFQLLRLCEALSEVQSLTIRHKFKSYVLVT